MPFVSLIIGYLSGAVWLNQYTLIFLVFLPTIWLSCKHRTSVFLLIGSYYLSANQEMIAGMWHFFAGYHDIFFAVIIWIAHAFCLTLPWLVCYKAVKNSIQIYWRIFCVMFLSIVPPIGLINTH